MGYTRAGLRISKKKETGRRMKWQAERVKLKIRIRNSSWR